MVDKQQRIAIDSAVLVGKPVIQSTRLTVEFVNDLLAQGCLKIEVGCGKTQGKLKLTNRRSFLYST